MSLTGSELSMCKLVGLLRELVQRSKILATPADLLGILLVTTRGGPMGRARLARSLGLGEGAARSLIQVAKRAGLVETSSRGVRPVESIVGELSKLKVAELAPSSDVLPWSSAVLVQLCARPPRLNKANALRVRDGTVRWGALGCVIAVNLRGGLLEAPGLDEPEILGSLKSELMGSVEECEGVIGVLGRESPYGRPWPLVYGFLEALCEVLAERLETT